MKRQMKPTGQALIPLLIVMLIALGLGAAAVEVAVSNILVDRYHLQTITGYYAAESALEEAFLGWLRDPNYTSGSLQVNQASCTIEVSGSSSWMFLVACSTDRWIRKLSAQATYVNGEMVITSVSEIQ